MNYTKTINSKIFNHCLCTPEADVVDAVLTTHQDHFQKMFEHTTWNKITYNENFRHVINAGITPTTNDATHIAFLCAFAICVGRKFRDEGASAEFLNQFSKDIETAIERRGKLCRFYHYSRVLCKTVALEVSTTIAASFLLSIINRRK